MKELCLQVWKRDCVLILAQQNTRLCACAHLVCVGGARGGCMMEKRYENREHERGAVTASVPEDFTDLSTVHHSLGSLSVQVNALRLEVY